MIFTKKYIIVVFSALFIFLYSINFMGYREFYPLIIIPVLILFIIKLWISKWFLVTQFALISFLFLYGLMTAHYGYYSYFEILGRVIFPPLFLLIGYYIANLDTDKKTNSLIILLIMITGSTIYGFTSLIKSIYTYGSYSNVINALGGRLTLDFWGTNYISATVLNSSVSLGLSAVGILFLKNKKYGIDGGKINRKTLNFFILLIFILSLYTSLTLGNRTGLLIAVISFFNVIMLHFKFNMSNLFRLLSILMGLYIFKIIFFNWNIFELRSRWESSFIYSRFKSSSIYDNSRFDAWTTIIMNFNENLLGGREIELKLNFAHNFWLDVFYDAGLLPLIFLIIFTLISLFSLYKFLNLDISTIYKGLITGLYTAFLLTFLVEPILQGFVVFFTLYCFMLGIIQRKNENISNS